MPKFRPCEVTNGADGYRNPGKKPGQKSFKVYDRDGLFLLVNPGGSKLWRWRYRVDGKEKLMAFGEYPLVNLGQARELHFAARKMLASGTDPMAQRKAKAEVKLREAEARQREAQSSFENIAGKWWEWWSVSKSPRHADYVLRRLKADIFPALGHKFIDTVTAADIRELMLAIERRDARDVAKRAHETTGQIFRYAITRGMASRNPAADFKPRDILAEAKTDNFARVDARDLPELLAKMDEYNGETPASRAGTGSCGLFPRGVVRRQRQEQTHLTARSQSQRVD